MNKKMLLIGGLLPIIAFAVVEEVYGTLGGLIAGIVLGAGEMIWEYVKTGRIQGITIGSNLLVIVLGAVSLYEGSSLWFKLQPAVMLLVFAVTLFLSSIMKKPLLTALARKQNPNLPEPALARLAGLNFRMGFVFLALTALSVHAALYWTTAAWATLKGIGVPVLVFAYILAEAAIMRFFR